MPASPLARQSFHSLGPIRTDKHVRQAARTRSSTLVHPTTFQYLLGDGTTAQDTAANRAAQPSATVIDNASDGALLGLIVIGCTVWQVPSLDDSGAKVGSLVTEELQARQFQQALIALVPLNDPDCLLTSSGAVSPSKTNTYRLDVDQDQLGAAANGSLDNYCSNVILIAPPFFQINSRCRCRYQSLHLPLQPLPHELGDAHPSTRCQPTGCLPVQWRWCSHVVHNQPFRKQHHGCHNCKRSRNGHGCRGSSECPGNCCPSPGSCTSLWPQQDD